MISKWYFRVSDLRGSIVMNGEEEEAIAIFQVYKKSPFRATINLHYVLFWEVFLVEPKKSTIWFDLKCIT